VTGRRGRRRRKLLDDLKERRGYSHLKEEALDRTTRMWRARFGRGFGPVVRHTKCMSKIGRSDYKLCLSVCPYKTIRLPLDEIFIKFDVGGVFENPSTKFKFH
jgi:hypothetical protein